VLNQHDPADFDLAAAQELFEHYAPELVRALERANHALSPVG